MKKKLKSKAKEKLYKMHILMKKNIYPKLKQQVYIDFKSQANFPILGIKWYSKS